MYKILKDTDPFLYKIVPEYTGDYKDIKQISDDMITTMLYNNGIGLSANQVGLNFRIFVMGDINYGFWVIVNPKILNVSRETCDMIEGCLSFPSKKYLINRSKIIDVEYYDINGHLITTQFKEIWARCFMHELDHLNGITFDKRATFIDVRAKETFILP